MNTRLTWWLVGTALALFVLLVVLERRDRTAAGADDAAAALLAGFEPIQITSLEISRSNQTIRAERRAILVLQKLVS